MIFQAEVLAQTLRLAQEKALALVQAALPRLEVEAALLQREVQAVLRQAVALQQLAALPQEQVALQQVQERVQEPLERVQEKVQGLVEAEAQVEVLEAGQVQDLVQAPLLVEDWVGWVQVEKEKE